MYICIDKVNLGTEISTTKQLSENVAQPGIEPGSISIYISRISYKHAIK